MIIMGIALCIFGALTYVTSLLQDNIYFIIGNVVLGVGLVIGCGISFYAMKKYNKGVF